MVNLKTVRMKCRAICSNKLPNGTICKWQSKKKYWNYNSYPAWYVFWKGKSPIIAFSMNNTLQKLPIKVCQLKSCCLYKERANGLSILCMFVPLMSPLPFTKKILAIKLVHKFCRWVWNHPVSIYTIICISWKHRVSAIESCEWNGALLRPVRVWHA